MRAEKAVSAGEHPCFDAGVRERVGRIHLPVAPRCNLDCHYCERYWCAHESRPGLASALLRPDQVAATLRRHLAADGRLRVVGIAGPGEPLDNPETFEALAVAKRWFPDLSLCVSTNGLLLPRRADALHGLGVRYVTVTINSVDPETSGRMTASVRYQGRTYRGLEAGRLLVENQLAGLRLAARLGMRVKVNCVLAPEVNGAGVVDVARAARAAGGSLLNVIPLIPRSRFSEMRAPARRELEAVRSACEPILPQMRHCRRCRADAVGLLDGRAPAVAAAPAPPLRVMPGACGGRGDGSGTGCQVGGQRSALCKRRSPSC